MQHRLILLIMALSLPGCSSCSDEYQEQPDATCYATFEACGPNGQEVSACAPDQRCSTRTRCGEQILCQHDDSQDMPAPDMPSPDMPAPDMEEPCVDEPPACRDGFAPHPIGEPHPPNTLGYICETLASRTCGTPMFACCRFTIDPCDPDEPPPVCPEGTEQVERCYEGEQGCEVVATCRTRISCRQLEGPCAPQLADIVGDCDLPLGVRWDGSACEPVSGCTCVGTECGALYTDLATCQQDHAGCLDP